MDFRMARPLKDSGRFTIVKESRALNVAREFGARDTGEDRPIGAPDASAVDHPQITQITLIPVFIICVISVICGWLLDLDQTGTRQ